MNRARLKRLLEQVRSGKVDVGEAVERIHAEPLRHLGFATLDLQRASRRGFPEVVYGPGKTPEQIVRIVRGMREAGQTVLVTRVGPEVRDAVAAEVDGVEYHEVPSALVVRGPARRGRREGILVMTAGTADLPVAEEAALTAELMGNRVARVTDVGVAGIHRLMAHRETLVRARVIVVVAGMDGVLPSFVGGLVDCPVIGVPTSTGYGFGGDGEAALMTMLNSCSPGLTVVNIDNGFGAGFAAGLINAPASRSTRRG